MSAPKIAQMIQFGLGEDPPVPLQSEQIEKVVRPLHALPSRQEIDRPGQSIGTCERGSSTMPADRRRDIDREVELFEQCGSI